MGYYPLVEAFDLVALQCATVQDNVNVLPLSLHTSTAGTAESIEDHRWEFGTEIIVNATRCPPRPEKGPATGDRQLATGSNLHKTIELSISQVLYKQSCVYNIGIVNILLVF